MEIQELKILKFTQGEIKVYSAILNEGIATINNIHERTFLERRAIYDIINKLVGKGLINYTVEKGKRTYQCAPPNKLRMEVDKRKEELDKLRKLIPEIEKIYNSSKPSVRAEIYRGKEGIKAIFEDMLNYKDIYAISGGWYIVKELPYYWPSYNKRRIKSGVVWHNLVRHEFKKERLPGKKLINVKILPEEFSGSPAVIIIYGYKVVNLLWGTEYFAFLIENKGIAENYKKYHRYLWDNVAKKL